MTNSSIQKFSFFFFFNDTATTEIYTLSLHDALPISFNRCCARMTSTLPRRREAGTAVSNNGCLKNPRDRKSTRLNSSHSQISYAVFCLKKKKKPHQKAKHACVLRQSYLH